MTHLPIKARHDSRAVAAVILKAVINQQASLASIEQHCQALSDADRALVQTLCYNVCRHYFALLECTQGLIKKPLKEKDQDIQSLILIGIWQLYHMRIPQHAAIHSCVQACRALGKPWAAHLVNAILRKLQAQHIDASFISEHRNLPNWIYKTLRRDWPEQHIDIQQQSNQAPNLCLRLMSSSQRQVYIDACTAADINASAGELCTSAVLLEQAIGVRDIPGFMQGEVSVQDQAAQLAAHILQIQDGENVLDACAAPGGKSCHILEMAKAKLTAIDIDAQRCSLIRENLQRAQLQAHIIEADASQPDKWHNGESYDAILLDAPCSGSGVLRRHPDIKLLRRASDIAQLHTLQARILNALWPLLKPGGRMLYATCSIFKQENEEQIRQFVSAHSDAKIHPINAAWGEDRQVGRQLFPSAINDGFFYALLYKDTSP